MLTSPQLRRYFPDLRDERFASALALVHSRFSTNTFPSWELAHPYRMVAHNGEINTLRGNVNWMRARESQLASQLFGDDLDEGAAGRPARRLRHRRVRQRARAAGALRPLFAARADDDGARGVRGRTDISDELRGFYAFHECLTEAWDGPAAIAFTDGRVIGATLDRNGLRPGRWLETDDGWVVLASEAGVLDIPPRTSCARAACSRGSCSSSTSTQGRIVPDHEVKQQVATQKPYGEWFEREHVRLADLPARATQQSRPSRCDGCSSRSATRRRT